MAATLEGAFELRDRASATLIKMRVEAERTDKAFDRLGRRMDSVASNQRVQRLTTTSRSLRTLGVDADNAAKRTDTLARRTKQADAAMGGWGGRLRMVTRGVRDFGMELFKIARPGAILTGLPALLGLAGQAVGSLGGSLGALAPRLADLGSLSVVALPAITGLAGGMALLSSASKSLGQAMQGGTAGAQALLRGGPAMAGVVRQLRAMRFELMGLQRAGQAPIFRALSGVLPMLRGQLPALRGMLGDIGGAMGQAITGAARGTLGDRGFMRDLRGLTGQGGGVIRAAGQAATYLARGLASVGAAAAPLTRWVNQLVVGWARHFEQTMKARRASGQLTQQFDRARTAASGLFKFLGNVYVALRNIGRDARPAGELLYRWLGGAAASWRAMTGDANRSVRLTQQFLGMTRGFIALGNLIGHLSTAIFNMGAGAGFPRLVQSLDRLIPSLTQFFGTMADSFGPALANLLGTMSKTFELLGGGAGSPMLMVLNALNGILGAVNGIVRALGPLGGVLSAAFEAGLILRFLSRLRLVEVGWRRVTVAASEAAAAEGAAMGGGGFGLRLGPALRGFRGGRAGVGRGLSWLGTFRRGGPANYARAAAMAGEGEQLALPLAASGAVATAGRGAMLRGGLMGAGRLGLGVASKFLLPLAGIMGAFGALSAQRSGNFGNQVAQTAYGGLNAASGGLIGAGLGAMGVHPLETQEQQAARLVSLSQRRLNQGLRNADAGSTGMRRLNREVDVLQATMQGFARDQTDAGKQYREQLQQEIDARKQVISNLKTEANTRAAQRSGDFAASLNRVYQTQGPAAARAAGLAAIAAEPSKTTRRYEANTLLSGFTGAARDRLGRQLAPMVGGVYGGGLIEAGGQAERTALREAITLPGGNTAALRQQLYANLTASGYVGAYGPTTVHGWITSWIARGMRGPIVPRHVTDYWARRNRQASQARGRHINPTPAPAAHPGSAYAPPAGSRLTPRGFVPMHATGGRLAGVGVHDTVPLGGVAAPGELVVNRHTERKVNYLLGPHGASLGGMVAGETTPHSRRYARGGRVTSQAGVNTRDVNKALLSDLQGLAGSGHTVVITSGYRSVAKQQGLWDRYVQSGFNRAYIAARPGQSAHNFGLAVDAFIDRSPAAMFGAAQLRRYGLVAPVGGDPVHLELAAASPQLLGLAVARKLAGSTSAVAPSGLPAAGGGAAATSPARGGGRATAGMFPTYSVARALRGQSGSVFGLGGLSIAGDQGPLAAAAGGGGGGGRGGGGGGGGGGGAGTSSLDRVFPRFIQGTGGQHAQLTPSQVSTLAGQAGLPASMFTKIARGESSYYPGIQQRDPGDGMVGYGLLQMTPNAWGAGSAALKYMTSLGGIPAMFNPVKNLKMAKFLYDHATSKIPNTPGFPWYGTRFLEKGGRVPRWGGWHQGGLDRTFSTPTVIGVGEGGQAERVRVTQTGRGGGGGAQINATFYITGGDPGHVRREVEAALHSFADELDRHHGSDVGGN